MSFAEWKAIFAVTLTIKIIIEDTKTSTVGVALAPKAHCFNELCIMDSLASSTPFPSNKPLNNKPLLAKPYITLA